MPRMIIRIKGIKNEKRNVGKKVMTCEHIGKASLCPH